MSHLRSLTPTSDKTDATLEALHVLLSVSASKDGLNRLLDPDVLRNVCGIISESSNGNHNTSVICSL